MFASNCPLNMIKIWKIPSENDKNNADVGNWIFSKSYEFFEKLFEIFFGIFLIFFFFFGIFWNFKIILGNFSQGFFWAEIFLRKFFGRIFRRIFFLQVNLSNESEHVVKTSPKGFSASQKFLGFFWGEFFSRFFGGFSLEDFLGGIFLGGIFLEDFLGGFFWRNSLAGITQ